MISVVAALPVKVLPVDTRRDSLRMRLSLIGMMVVVIVVHPLFLMKGNLAEKTVIFQTMMCCTRLQYKEKMKKRCCFISPKLFSFAFRKYRFYNIHKRRRGVYNYPVRGNPLFVCMHAYNYFHFLRPSAPIRWVPRDAFPDPAK